MLVAAAPSQARRLVPNTFMGAQWANTALVNASPSAQDAEAGRMARSGVETVRMMFEWGRLEPTEGHFDFSSTDQVARVLAKHRISLLPTVMFSPRWASSQPSRPDFYSWPDTSAQGIARYDALLRALIGRYGPNGSFWKANRGVPKMAIRYWQIWNEPDFRVFWGPPNYAQTYVKLLKSAYRTVHKADRGAKVVMAGLANGGAPYLSWTALDLFYKQGVRRYYDILALHPFGVNFVDVKFILDQINKVLRRYRDTHRRIWFTEFFYSAAKGKGARPVIGLEVTTAQQKKYLAQAYTYFGTHRSLRIDRIYWEPWESTYNNSVDAGQPAFNYAGMVAPSGRGFKAMPILSTFISIARKLEGCKKNSVGRCTR